MTNLLHTNEKFDTVHNKRSKIPPSVHLNTLCNWCVKIEYCSSELIEAFFIQAAASKMPKKRFVSCIQLSFANFALRPIPSNKNQSTVEEVCAPHSNSSIYITIQKQTHIHMNFLLTMTETNNLPHIDFPLESPCIILVLDCVLHKTFLFLRVEWLLVCLP